MRRGITAGLLCVLLFAGSVSAWTDADPVDAEESTYQSALAEHAEMDSAITFDGDPCRLDATVSSQPSSAAMPRRGDAEHTQVARPRSVVVRSRVVPWDATHPASWAENAHNTRLLIREGNVFGGLIVERDRYEPALADYRNATLSLGFRSDSVRVVLGAMAAHVGTGLIAGRSGTAWTNATSFRPREMRLAPSLATAESGALDGVGVRYVLPAWDLVALYTMPRWDASIDTAEGAAATLREGGTHVTDAQILGRRAVKETFFLVGLNRRFGSAARVGITGAHGEYSQPLRLNPQKSPVTSNTIYGANANVSSGALDVWGESAMARPFGDRLAAGVRYSGRSASLTFAGWRYTDASLFLHGAGWSLGSEADDEKALAATLQWAPTRSIKITGFVAQGDQKDDMVADASPRRKTIEELRWNWQMTERVLHEGRWKLTRYSRLGEGTDSEDRREDWVGSWDWLVGAGSARFRFNAARGISRSRGILVSLQGSFPVPQGFRVTACFAAHETNSTLLPLYLYERRSLDYGTVRAIYRSGASWALLASRRTGRFAASLSASGSAPSANGRLTVTAQIDYVLR